jgi:hypothetical protein
MGLEMENSSSFRTDPKEPTSFHVTSGIVAKPSRFAEGWTFPTASCPPIILMRHWKKLLHLERKLARRHNNDLDMKPWLADMKTQGQPETEKVDISNRSF